MHQPNDDSMKVTEWARACRYWSARIFCKKKKEKLAIDHLSTDNDLCSTV